MEELALRTQGPRAELFAIACVLLNQFGQLVACLIVIGDLGSPTVASLLGGGARAGSLGVRALVQCAFVLLSVPCLSGRSMAARALGLASAVAVLSGVHEGS